MSIEFLTFFRDDVISYLGAAWPLRPGEQLLRIPESAGITDGALITREAPDQPGRLWWLIDGTVPTQAAGPVTEALAALVPDSVLETVPDPNADAVPPWTPTNP